MSSIKYCDTKSAKLELQIQADQTPKTGCIFFAPYPKMGGTMSFPMLRQLYYMVNPFFDLICRFNYRGSGNSTGSFQSDLDGYNDGKAIYEFLRDEFPDLTKFTFIGYSYGSAIAAKLSSEILGVYKYIGISPPFFLFPSLFASFTDVSNAGHVTKYFIIGTKDQFTSIQDFSKIRNIISDGHFLEIEGIDHFWQKTNQLEEEIKKIL